MTLKLASVKKIDVLPLSTSPQFLQYKELRNQSTDRKKGFFSILRSNHTISNSILFVYSFFSATIQVAFQAYIEHLEVKTANLRLKFELKCYRKILVTSWKDFRTNESTDLKLMKMKVR